MQELDTMIELLNCDCMEYMATVPDKYFDLAIVDPPYGINASKGTWGSSNKGKVTDYGKKDWDKEPATNEYFEHLFRVSKQQIIWGANHFIERINKNSSCWVVWNKKTVGNTADCELAWTSFKTSVRRFDFMWEGFWQENMKNKELRIHPTQKPIPLYEWILHRYAKKGQRILDTHLGSGSSAIAAHYFGVDFVGCELDKDYFEAAKARFDMATKQLAMSI